jgi:hypothetical protein
VTGLRSQPDCWVDETFIERVIPKLAFGEHWLYVEKNRTGTNKEYGALQWRGRKEPLHRLSYSFFNCNGLWLPTDLDVHHVCRIKLCIHPDHLELHRKKAHKEAEADDRRFCPNGHDKWLVGTVAGRNRCLICHRDDTRRSRRRTR